MEKARWVIRPTHFDTWREQTERQGSAFVRQNSPGWVAGLFCAAFPFAQKRCRLEAASDDLALLLRIDLVRP
jgi:hypothetical protein